MRAEIARNGLNEPCVSVFPETEEENQLLREMRGKFRGEDGNHVLMMGSLDNNGEMTASFVLLQRGHLSTIGR